MNVQYRSLLGGLACAGLLSAPSLFAAGQQQGGGADKPTRQERTSPSDDARLELKLQPASTLSFRVKRGGGPESGAGMPGERGTGREPGARDRGTGNTGRDTGNERGTQDRPGQAGGIGAMGQGMTDLRLDLRPERASAEGTTMIRVEVSRGEASPSTTGRDGGLGDPSRDGDLGGNQRERGDGELGDADSKAKAAKKVASFRVLVDDDGRILRMEEATVAAGDNADPGQTRQRSSGGALDEALLRNDLAIILGTGLHAVPLKNGMTYEIGGESPVAGTPVEASGRRGTPSGSEPRSFQVRFEELRDARQVTGATEGRVAAFSVLPESGARVGGLGQPGIDPAGRGDTGRGTDEREGAGGNDTGRADAGRLGGTGAVRGDQIGRALYSLEDGLLNRFEVRPQPMVQGRVDRPDAGGQPGRDDDEPGRGDAAGRTGDAQGRGLGADQTKRAGRVHSLIIERIESGSTGAAGGR